MSLGMERIIEVIGEFDLLPARPSVANIFVACLPETIADASHHARVLRAHGINADLTLLTNRSLGEQLRYADRRGIPWALIIGTAELERNVATVRNLKTQEQREIDLGLLVEEVRRITGA